MKRYVHPLKSFASSPNYAHLYCKPAVEYCEWTEVQALLRAVAEEVNGMAHGEDCPAVAGCRLCGLHPDEIFHNPRAKTTLGIDAHEFAPGDCECPRGKVLAMLEVE